MIYNTEENKIQGWMGDNELCWLFNKALNATKIVEIGSWKGRSTHALLSGTKGFVLAVDHWLGNPEERDTAHKEATERDIFQDFLRNTQEFTNLLICKQYSTVAAALFPDNFFDLCFIDGSHIQENAKQDILAWLPKCSGILCGHDYNQASIPEIGKELNLNFKCVEGTIWVLER